MPISYTHANEVSLTTALPSDAINTLRRQKTMLLALTNIYISSYGPPSTHSTECFSALSNFSPKSSLTSVSMLLRLELGLNGTIGVGTRLITDLDKGQPARTQTVPAG